MVSAALTMMASLGPAALARSAGRGGGAAAGIAVIVAMFLHGIYCEVRRRRRLKKLAKKLEESIASLKQTVRTLTERTKVLRVYSTLKRKRADKAIQCALNHLKHILTPQQAKLILNKGLVVNVLRGQIWETALFAHVPKDINTEEKDLKLMAEWGTNSDDEENYLRTIKADLARTFINTNGFERGGAMLPRLERVLRAYASSDSQIRYVQGMNSVAGMACMVASSDAQAYRITSAIMKHPFYSHRDVFGRGKRGKTLGFPLACQLGWMLDRLMEKHHPDLASHLNKTLKSLHCEIGIFSGLNVAYMALKWFLTLFASVLPPSLCLHIYDKFIVEGHIVALRVAMLTIRDMKDELLSLPIGDTQILQPRLWHHYSDDEKYDRNSNDSDPSLRNIWKKNARIIMEEAEQMPPSNDEFVLLRESYLEFQQLQEKKEDQTIKPNNK